MKKILFALFLLCATANISAQEKYITNLYIYDPFILNPAAAGVNKLCNAFGLFYRDQWVGVEDSPTTQLIDYQTGITNQFGSGTYIYNDRNGNSGDFGIHQALSYEVILTESNKQVSSLSFGLGFTLSQRWIDQSDFVDPSMSGDPVLTGGKQTGWGANGSAGLIYKYNDWDVGFAALNLLPNNNTLLGEDGVDNSVELNYYVKPLFNINQQDIFLEPMLLYRQSLDYADRIDFSMKGVFPLASPDYALWTLVSFYQTVGQSETEGKSSGLGATLGVNYTQFSLGIEYLLSTTTIASNMKSGIQLVLRYNICRTPKHGAIPCPKNRGRKNNRFSGMGW